MGIRYFIIVILFAVFISGCAPPVSVWRHNAVMVLDRVRLDGGGEAFPHEYKSAEDAMQQAEALLSEREVGRADIFFQLAWTKAKLIEAQLSTAKTLREEELKRQAEARKIEILKQKELQEDMQRKLEKERAEADARLKAEVKKNQEKLRPVRERSLPSSHTTKRGETLPLIAAQPDVYNDASLWPLLYRANRDQIKDPRHIWPGQVLRIPRNFTRDDVAEARRYAREKPIY